MTRGRVATDDSRQHLHQRKEEGGEAGNKGNTRGDMQYEGGGWSEG